MSLTSKLDDACCLARCEWGIGPSARNIGGEGISTLVDERPVPLNGDVGVHDTAVWLEPVGA